MSTRLHEFRTWRERMNERILGTGHLGTNAYKDGALGGSIVIPHLRHAFEIIDLLREEQTAGRK